MVNGRLSGDLLSLYACCAIPSHLARGSGGAGENSLREEDGEESKAAPLGEPEPKGMRLPADAPMHGSADWFTNIEVLLERGRQDQRRTRERHATVLGR